MKTLKLILPALCLLLLFSCGKEEVLNIGDELTVETRRSKGDCVPIFEEGHIDDLFGTTLGDLGTFEQNAFPCLELSELPECCPERKVVENILIDGISNPLSFSTACNSTLDANEQQEIFQAIMLAANSRSVRCDDTRFSMSPVSFDVHLEGPLCIGNPTPPCTGPVETPCDCFNENPNHPYWEACQSFRIFVNVTYAYTGNCIGFTNG